MSIDRVANRSLFKNKSQARDKLRSLGGIMASSEPLLREARNSIQTIDRPRPPMTAGIMSANPRPPMMAQPMAPPMMAPPMAPPPMAPPQPQPAPPPPQPAPQPPMQPAPQPAPSLNPLAQNGRPAFALGGLINDPDTQARLAANTASPAERARTNMLGIDVTQKAGTLVERPEPQMINLKEMTQAQAARLAGDTLSGKMPFKSPFTEANVGDKAPELTAAMKQIGALIGDTNISSEEKSRILASYMGGDPSAKSMSKEMGRVAQKTFGKKINTQQKLDSINQAITGFAIAAGTSPRASVNVANGMLIGLGEMKKTENARAIAAAAPSGVGPGGAKSSTYRTPGNAYQDAIEDAMKMNVRDVPKGPDGNRMPLAQYAEQYARNIVANSYTPAQLVGTAFEGTSAMPSGGGEQPAPSTAPPTKEEFLIAARTANPNASEADLEKYYDNKYG